MKEEVTILYTNWKGETEYYTILPTNIWYGSTLYHPQPQWLLTAYVPAKRDTRDFALDSLKAWNVTPSLQQEGSIPTPDNEGSQTTEGGLPLIEEELKLNPQLALVTALIAFYWEEEDFTDLSTFLPYWNAQVETLSTHPGWKNGRHEGDCTKVPSLCNRCRVEHLATEAKKWISTFTEGSTTVATPPQRVNPS